jgi:hypothetical protein
MTPLALLLAAAVLAQAPATDRDFVHVCQDAGAGGYEAFPDVCRAPDGRLMAVFYAGWEHVSLPDAARPKGGRIVASYSSDEGRTWSPARTVYDSPDDDRDPSITPLPDGALLCVFFSLRKTGERKWDGLGSFAMRSEDGGASWSAPVQIHADYYVSAPARVLGDGSLVLGLYRANDADANGAVAHSRDGGRTWDAPVNIDNGGLRLDAETDVIELKDGRLYAAQRAASESMRHAVSEDKGRTWSVSAPMGFRGHAPYLYRAPSGVVIVAHRHPQTSLHWSADDTRTWAGPVLVDDFIGSYPSLVTLNDDTTLIVYYEEGEGSSIRARRFRATAAGIEWLPIHDAAGGPVE